MTNNVNLVANYILIVGLITNLALIALQLGTFRKTRHFSLAIMAAGTAFGFLYIAAAYAAREFWASGHNPLVLYILAAALLTIQSIIALWGLRALFRAFEQASSATRGGA